MTGKSKVLLVDDEQAITTNLAPFLVRSGFSVAVAADGEEALRQISTFEPDLIVLDVLMPRLDGRKALRRLCQAGDWTTVILLTQVGESTERAMALKEGADDYLNKPFDPHELVARIRAVLRRARPGQPPLTSALRLASGDLSLALPQAPWPVPDVPGDWDLLFLATYNLLDNAQKFTRPGDTVEVRAFEDRAFVIIEVADTGPGIPGDELPQVWEELYRGQGARGIPGSGLGLALARAVVDRHGGQVTLRSRAGQGTVVTVRLPVA